MTDTPPCDDVASVEPSRPRAVIAEGPAEAIPAGHGHGPLIRITTERITSCGLDDD